jgi:hypothetical protein
MERETRETWAKRIEEWQASGVSATEFAKKLGVAEKSLKWWRWKLSTPSKRRSKTAIVKVHTRAIEATPLTFIEMAATPAIEVVLRNGTIVRVASHFDEKALVRLLGVLEQR